VSTTATFFDATEMILRKGYSSWFFNRGFYENLKIQYLTTFQDITSRKFSIFFQLLTGHFRRDYLS
jgi:NADH:ubiquinone oxidoreductase subunit 4 (subunit M)